MQQYNGRTIVNIGTGEDISIAELAYKIKDLVGYRGRIVFDPSKPDGTRQKLLDVSRIHRLGWHHNTALDDGLLLAYQDFLEKQQALLETT
jgi:GDP-L-fucose synthase